MSLTIQQRRGLLVLVVVLGAVALSGLAWAQVHASLARWCMSMF